MATRLDPALLDEAARAFLAEHGAESGYFSLSPGGASGTEVYLSNGREAIEVPHGVRGSLVAAAIKLDGMVSTLYEFAGTATADALVEPRRSQFPDTVEGHSQYMRALGVHHARTRDANESAGRPPDGSPSMSRAEFESLDPLAKRQAMRDGVKLYD